MPDTSVVAEDQRDDDHDQDNRTDRHRAEEEAEEKSLFAHAAILALPREREVPVRTVRKATLGALGL